MPRVAVFLLASCLAAGCAAAAEPVTRFSQSVSPAERPALGLDRLSSDQTAILDALIRRDMAEREPSGAQVAEPTTFSLRLTADERKNSGLTVLTAEERQQIDAAVARYQTGGLTRTLLAPPIFLRHASAARTTEKKKEREIHGSMTLSYGWGEDGSSTRSGSLIMNMTDPDKKYSITIGYAESHGKGPAGSTIYPGPGPRYPGDLEYLRP